MVNSSTYILVVVIFFQTFLITALVYQNFHISYNGFSIMSKASMKNDIIEEKKVEKIIKDEVFESTLRPTPKVEKLAKKPVEINTVNKKLEETIPNLKKEKIFYNRVPKCGSRNIIDLLYSAARRNHFKFICHKEYVPFYHDEEYNKKTVSLIENKEGPLIYEGHYHFMRFEKYNSTQPTYINVIRDPLDRMMSWYYFIRFQPGHMRDMDNETRDRSFDECVRLRLPECVQPMGDDSEHGYFKIIPFFCGHEPFCRQPTMRALNQAKENVKKHYAVVGATEYLKETIEVLEYFLPSFFEGAKDDYERKVHGMKEKYKTIKRSHANKETQEVMKGLLALEYDFYEFVRQNLMNQLTEARKERRNLHFISIN